MHTYSSLHTDSSTDSNGYHELPLAATLTNGFFTVNINWIILYWNNAAEKILGKAAQDAVGINLLENFAAVLPSPFYALYQKAFLPGLPLHFEEYWGDMGSWFDVISYYSDGKLSVSFKSHNHSHTEDAQEPAKRLETLAGLYKLVTEITNDALWEWDFTTEEIFWIDGGHRRIFGYRVENALIPKSFWESRVHPADKLSCLPN